YNLASPRAFAEGTEKSLELLDEARGLAQGVGDRELIGRVHWMKGTVYYLTELAQVDDLEAALAEFRKAAEYLAGTTASFDIGWTERMIAIVLLGLGRPDEAEGHLRGGLERFVEAGDISALPLHISDFAQLALVRNQPERAILLAGAAAGLQAVSETRLLNLVANEIVGLQEAIDTVGTEQAEKLAAEGQSLGIDQVLALVMDQ
ncbi:MAG: hypothetical protein ACRDWH_11345, partial [Acidimicrobiia bacterium]